VSVVERQPARNAMAPLIDRARSRTAWPSLPLLTIHWPFDARPVIIPTWCAQTTIAPTLGPVAWPQWAQLRARLYATPGSEPTIVRAYQPHQARGRPPRRRPAHTGG